jgi:hypothetical protein
MKALPERMEANREKMVTDQEGLEANQERVWGKHGLNQ